MIINIIGMRDTLKNYTFSTFLKMHDPRLRNSSSYVRFEVFTAVTMKDAVFWDVAPFVQTDV
jgi:hypothetical protein